MSFFGVLQIILCFCNINTNNYKSFRMSSYRDDYRSKERHRSRDYEGGERDRSGKDRHRDRSPKESKKWDRHRDRNPRDRDRDTSPRHYERRSYEKIDIGIEVLKKARSGIDIET